MRLLFSAHGLPESIVAKGDPYKFQIESTVQAVVDILQADGETLDWVVCYQSRATPQKWLDPSTESAIEDAARDGCAVLVVPIAFVSEHSETLVELDVEYRELAERMACPAITESPRRTTTRISSPPSPRRCTRRAPTPRHLQFRGRPHLPVANKDCPMRQAA